MGRFTKSNVIHSSCGASVAAGTSADDIGWGGACEEKHAMGLDSGPLHLEKRLLKDLQIGRMGQGQRERDNGNARCRAGKASWRRDLGQVLSHARWVRRE